VRKITILLRQSNHGGRRGMGDFFKDLVYSKNEPSSHLPSEFRALKKPGIHFGPGPRIIPFEWLVCVDGTRLRFAIVNPLHGRLRTGNVRSSLKARPSKSRRLLLYFNRHDRAETTGLDANLVGRSYNKTKGKGKPNHHRRRTLRNPGHFKGTDRPCCTYKED